MYFTHNVYAPAYSKNSGRALSVTPIRPSRTPVPIRVRVITPKPYGIYLWPIKIFFLRYHSGSAPDTLIWIFCAHTCMCEGKCCCLYITCSQRTTKPTKWLCTKTQVSLGIRPVSSEFAVRMKKAWVLSYPLSTQRSDWADAQAYLSLRWAHMPFCSFCRALARISCSF